MAEKPQAGTAQPEKQEHQPSPSSLKKKKKKWVSLVAADEFSGAFLGESFVEEAEQVKGKVVEANLMMLTQDPKKQNMKVKFEVNEVKNNQGFATLSEFEMLPSHVKRLTKKAKAKVDDSFVCTTKDNIKIRLKPLIITKTAAHHSVLAQIQVAARAFLTDYAKKNTFHEMMKEVIAGEILKELKAHVKKYHAITGCMIRIAKKEQV